MNFTQSFEEFSKGLSSTDLMLYAGIALVVWILFKDKLSPVQGLFNLLSESIKRLMTKKEIPLVQSAITVSTNAPSVLATTIADNTNSKQPEDLFFKLVVSWKQTRDLAVKCGCDKAVEVADEMFPYLSPNVCGKDKDNE